MFPTTTTNGESQPASVLDAGTADGELSSSYVLHRSLHTKPLAVRSAKGHYLELDSGQLVLDACAGAAVACLGHGNEAVINAMTQQLSRMAYIHSQVYTAQPVEDLANLLIESTDHKMARVLFMNSGSEANEIAMKLARQYHLEKTPPEVQRDVFLSRRQSYHGASFATLALSGHLARQKRYMPFMLQNMRKTLPCNAYRDKRQDETDAAYVQRLADALENDILAVGADRVAGFFIETVGGASTGCTLPVPGYLMAMRRVCDKYGILLMLDEIMCGIGRTGTFHAWQQENIVPDIQTIAKGLGGGFVPLGAVLVNDRVVRALENGSGQFSHGQTFQSHVLCCATSAAVIRELIRPQVPESDQPAETLIMRSKRVGKLLLTLLSERVGSLAHVGDVRGRGLFMAIELVQDKVTKEPYELGFSAAYKVHAKALKLGVATYPGQATADGVRGDHILLAPPFAITEEECLVIVSTLEHAIKIALE